MAKKKRRMTKKLLRALRANIKKARKKWMKMPTTARQKVMPAKLTKQELKALKKVGKLYPVGQYVTVDVGKPKGHYIVAKKTKYGWEKSRAGLITRKQLLKRLAKARSKRTKK